ncbi:MAG: RecQ family zinc-binding domain-containing protein, partial [Muribaculaceae bacterium]|nr:RecQ family zinc-binding domain-containing protein [Muribaculaceae bacterium]
DEVKTAPRVRFIVTRHQLYEIDTTDDEEEVINGLLRSYPGLFTDFAFLDDCKLAARCMMNRQQLYGTLINLARRGIIQFIPGKETPYITFTRNRVDESRVYLTDDAFRFRQERFVERIRAMEHYATDEEHCRSRLLLQYFGEENSCDCGRCDVCCGKRPDPTPDIIKKVKALLANGPMHLEQLAVACQCSQESLVKALRFMRDEGLIQINQKKIVSLRH